MSENLIILIPFVVFIALWLILMWYMKVKSIKPGLKTHSGLKLFSLIILFIGIFGFFSFLLSSITDKSLILEVQKESGEKTYKRLEFPDYSYITGNEGDLYYTTQSFFERVVLKDIGGKTIINVTAWLIISILIYRTVSSLSDKKNFSSNLSRNFKHIAYIVTLLPLVNIFFQELVVSNIILEKTNNMFSLNPADEFMNILPGLLLLMFIYFIDKGMEMQKDQELTI